MRTYLLAYSRYYSSLSMTQLCDMFELPERKVGLPEPASTGLCIDSFFSAGVFQG